MDLQEYFTTWCPGCPSSQGDLVPTPVAILDPSSFCIYCITTIINI